MKDTKTPGGSRPPGANASGKVAGGFTPAEAAALHSAARDNDKTPSAVLAAFCPAFTETGGLTLVPYSAQQRLILENSKSPLLKPGAADDSAVTIAEICFAIWVLSQTGAQLRAFQRQPDVDAFNAAMNSIAEHLPGHDGGLAAVRRQLVSHIAASCVTVIAPGLGAGGGDGDPLATGRSPATAAAGSST
jgi:hypothetical protein